MKRSLTFFAMFLLAALSVEARQPSAAEAAKQHRELLANIRYLSPDGKEYLTLGEIIQKGVKSVQIGKTNCPFEKAVQVAGADPRVMICGKDFHGKSVTVPTLPDYLDSNLAYLKYTIGWQEAGLCK